MHYIKFLLLSFLFFISCDDPSFVNDPSSVNDASTVVDTSSSDTGSMSMVIRTVSRPYWYYDSLFEDIIYPSTSTCKPGQFCVFVSTGPWDYTCTVFPDTFWGIIENDFSSTDSFICYSDTAWSLHDAFFIDLKDYLTSQSYSICSPFAKSYTKKGFFYKFSASETSVHIKNSCLDTTFYSSFSLPKIPLDSQDGVWFETLDTVFCPYSMFAVCPDTITYQFVKDYKEQSD